MTTGRHPTVENHVYGAARDLAGAPRLQSLGKTALEQLGKHRDREFQRAFWDLLATLGESKGEDWATERLRALMESARLTRELVGYLDDLTFHVHDSVRAAYLRFAADALSGLLPPELERHVGFLLRRLPTSAASLLRRIILHKAANLPCHDVEACGVLNRLVDAGFASHRQVPSSTTIDGDAPGWIFVFEEGRRAALQRYVPLLRESES